MNSKTLVFIFGLLMVAVVFADPDPEPEADAQPDADGDLVRSNYYRNAGGYYGQGRGRVYDQRYTNPNYYGRYGQGYPGQGSYYGRYGQGYDRYNGQRYGQRYGNYYGRYGHTGQPSYYGKAYEGQYRTY